MSIDNSIDYQKHLAEQRQYWDSEAPTFDEEADHGLRNDLTRKAWKQVLIENLTPKSEGEALDVGCGTGSLSLLLAEIGFAVTGIDISSAMIKKAMEKADQHNQEVEFYVSDAAFPDVGDKTFDVILCRHVLWALPEPKQVLIRWIKLLKPKGKLLLIEGYWHTGGGLRANEIISIIPETMKDTRTTMLDQNPELWGKEVNDERYIIGTTKAE